MTGMRWWPTYYDSDHYGREEWMSAFIAKRFPSLNIFFAKIRSIPIPNIDSYVRGVAKPHLYERIYSGISCRASEEETSKGEWDTRSHLWAAHRWPWLWGHEKKNKSKLRSDSSPSPLWCPSLRAGAEERRSGSSSNKAEPKLCVQLCMIWCRYVSNISSINQWLKVKFGPNIHRIHRQLFPSLRTPHS